MDILDVVVDNAAVMRVWKLVAKHRLLAGKPVDGTPLRSSVGVPPGLGFRSYDDLVAYLASLSHEELVAQPGLVRRIEAHNARLARAGAEPSDMHSAWERSFSWSGLCRAPLHYCLHVARDPHAVEMTVRCLVERYGAGVAATKDDAGMTPSQYVDRCIVEWGMHGLKDLRDDLRAMEMVATKQMPAEFVCRLSGRALREPVIAFDGYSYDAAAWRRYTRGRAQVPSPATNASIPAMAVPNLTLQQLVKSFVEER